MLQYLTFIVCVLVSSVYASPNARIIGGANATAGQFPFIAAVYKTTPNGEFFCSATLIDKQWLLTAGQCVDGGTLFTIHFSLLRLSEAKNPVATESYVLHPEYDPSTLANDIGLIKLREPVSYTTWVNPLSLPVEDVVPTSEGTACGWGQTSDADGELNDHLHYVKLTHVTDAECRITYGGQITDTMACFEGNYNEGTCIGDTGSPLIQRPGLNNFIIALASFISGNGCESTDPSGYTRVFPYNDWIKSVIADTM